MLTDAQIERYSRQIILPQVGGRGQQRLLSASVAVVGTGQVAATALAYLAAAGIGGVSVVDAKPTSGTDGAWLAAIESLNPDCRIIKLPATITDETAAEIGRTHDIVIVERTGADQAGAALNRGTIAARTPLLWGCVVGATGYATVLAGYLPDAPCLTCLLEYRRDWTTGAEPNAFTRVTGAFVGTLQATEALKLILGMNGTLLGRLLAFDALGGKARETIVAKTPHCDSCAGAACVSG